MKLSTIMVCRNAEGTIRRAIESFLEQDHHEKELVVIDGSSTDGTCAVVRSFDAPEIRLVSEPDKGVYDAMNKGLSLFLGEGFGFLNADDRYHDRTVLSRIADALRSAELVTGHLDFVARHDGAPPVRHWRATRYRAGAFRWGWAPAHPPTYARRTVYDRVGRFEPSFRVAGDYDWLLRALEIEGVSHAVIDHTLVDMAIGGISTAGVSSRLANARELLRARQLRLGTGPVDLAMFLGPLSKLRQLRPRRSGGLA